MANFSNYATLSYNGGTLNSNTVTGEIVQILNMTKTAVKATYEKGDIITYVISLVNSADSPLNALTITDDLGGYVFNEKTVYPLEYYADSVKLYVNGALQPSLTVEAGPPLVIEGINIPAGANAIIVYEAALTSAAPLGVGATITNVAQITGGGISAPLSATETVSAESSVNLLITKGLCPEKVNENGKITYTFIIENTGNTQALASDNVVLSDTFLPVLKNLTAAYNGTLMGEGNYTYNDATGEFATTAGFITVPAATYTQNEDGSFTITPGTAKITVTGTI